MSATALLQSCVTACGTMQGHRDWVLCVEWSPDGKLLVSGSKDGQILVWDAVSTALKGQCKASPPPPPPSPALSPTFFCNGGSRLWRCLHTRTSLCGAARSKAAAIGANLTLPHHQMMHVVEAARLLLHNDGGG